MNLDGTCGTCGAYCGGCSPTPPSVSTPTVHEGRNIAAVLVRAMMPAMGDDCTMDELRAYAARLAPLIAAAKERLDQAVESVLIADIRCTDPIPLDLADALNQLRRCRYGSRQPLTAHSSPDAGATQKGDDRG